MSKPRPSRFGRGWDEWTLESIRRSLPHSATSLESLSRLAPDGRESVRVVALSHGPEVGTQRRAVRAASLGSQIRIENDFVGLLAAVQEGGGSAMVVKPLDFPEEMVGLADLEGHTKQGYGKVELLF